MGKFRRSVVAAAREMLGSRLHVVGGDWEETGLLVCVQVMRWNEWWVLVGSTE